MSQGITDMDIEAKRIRQIALEQWEKCEKLDRIAGVGRAENQAGVRRRRQKIGKKPETK